MRTATSHSMPAAAQPSPGHGLVSEGDSVPTEALRRAAELARDLCVDDAPEAAERVSERLERDLLPRTAQGAPYLVVGVDRDRKVEPLGSRDGSQTLQHAEISRSGNRRFRCRAEAHD